MKINPRMLLNCALLAQVWLNDWRSKNTACYNVGNNKLFQWKLNVWPFNEPNIQYVDYASVQFGHMSLGWQQINAVNFKDEPIGLCCAAAKICFHHRSHCNNNCIIWLQLYRSSWSSGWIAVARMHTRIQIYPNILSRRFTWLSISALCYLLSNEKRNSPVIAGHINSIVQQKSSRWWRADSVSGDFRQKTFRNSDVTTVYN